MSELFYRTSSLKMPVTRRVPGKLFVSGEYAILGADQHAILVAVDQYLACQITPSESTFQLKSQALQQSKLQLESLDDIKHIQTQDFQEWRYILQALRISQQILAELNIPLQTFALTIQSELNNDQGLKYGLGSSGAVTVATLESVLAFHGVHWSEPATLFKLAVITLMQLGSNGSFADIATNVLGGWVYYHNFDRSSIQTQLDKQIPLLEMLEEDWPGLRLETLRAPDDLHLAIGWTQAPASTDNLVALLHQRTKGNAHAYEQFTREVHQLVHQLYQAFEEGNTQQILQIIRQNRQALQNLGDAYNLPIETDDLVALIEIAEAHGYASKSSGAGGGDCGIALSNQNKQPLNSLVDAWQAANIQYLPLSPAPERYEERNYYDRQSITD